MRLHLPTLNPVARISLGLVALLVSLLMAADLAFGLIPDRTALARQVRQQISESLAVQAATLLQSGDVVVAISGTGRTRDLLRSVEFARQAGADVVGITASGSPLAKLSTVALCADVEEDPDIYSPMTSRIAHLAIIDVLAVGVALSRGPGLLARLEKAKQSLRERRVPRHKAGASRTG